MQEFRIISRVASFDAEFKFVTDAAGARLIDSVRPVLQNKARSFGLKRYDGTIAAAINIGTHVDRVPTEEMIRRFLPLLSEHAAQATQKLV